MLFVVIGENKTLTNHGNWQIETFSKTEVSSYTIVIKTERQKTAVYIFFKSKEHYGKMNNKG